MRFRFLDRALWRMPLVPSFDVYGIASDGVKLYYDPEYVVARFKRSPNEVVRDVIHCLFHCIFRHPFMLYSVCLLYTSLLVPRRNAGAPAPRGRHVRRKLCVTDRPIPLPL